MSSPFLPFTIKLSRWSTQRWAYNGTFQVLLNPRKDFRETEIETEMEITFKWMQNFRDIYGCSSQGNITGHAILERKMYLLELSWYKLTKGNLPVVILSGFVSFSSNQFPGLFQDSQ